MAAAEATWWGLLGFLSGVLLGGLKIPLAWIGVSLFLLLAAISALEPRYLALLLVLPAFLCGGMYPHFSFVNRALGKIHSLDVPFFDQAKIYFLASLSRYLPPEEAGFLGGLTLGAKGEFSKQLLADLRSSGTTHLVAISGYNVQLITVALFGWLLSIFKRHTAFWLSAFFLVIFILMVGGSASVLRAGIMGFLYLVSAQIGRKYIFRYVVVWAAFLMVIFDPSVLLSPGFWLSYASLFGIVCLSPTLLAISGHESGENWLMDLVAQTCAAGLAVLPITLLFFGNFSLTSFLANILILPIIPATTLLGFLIIGVGLVSAPLAYPFAWCARILLSYELAVIHFFAKISLPARLDASAYLILSYYLCLLGVVSYFEAG